MNTESNVVMSNGRQKTKLYDKIVQLLDDAEFSNSIKIWIDFKYSI